MSIYKKDKGANLDRSICSVWSDQTLRPSQIVLVEDGPLTEELHLTINKWKNILGDVLLLLKNERNLGLTKSLNRAIGVVNQEYIARIDADDISLPCRFELQSAFLDANPDVDVVGGSLIEFDEQCDMLNIRHYPQTPEECRRYIHKACPVAHPAVMMRKRLFDSGVRYDERYRVSQDIALWFDVLSSGFNIANIRNEIVRFRRSDDMFQRRGREKAFNEFCIYMRGIYRMSGVVTWKYVYPIVRLMFRLCPRRFIKTIYNSRVRMMLLESKKS